MLVASARVATWVSVAKVVLGFSVHLPPLSEAIQTELKTSSVSTAGNSYCWHVILILFLHYHYIIITLSLHSFMVSFFSLRVSLSLFHVRGWLLASHGVYRQKPFHHATTLSGTARQLSSSFRSSRGLRDGSFGTKFEGTSHRLV